MDIIKTFQDEYNVRIFGVFENPLFVAVDIGKILGISNILTTLRNFDADYIVKASDLHTINPDHVTTNLQPETKLFTELGLYHLLSISRKPLAKVFRKWMYSIVKELRIKRKYDIDEQIKNNNKEILNFINTVKNLKQENQELNKENKNLKQENQELNKKVELIEEENETFLDVNLAYYKDNSIVKYNLENFKNSFYNFCKENLSEYNNELLDKLYLLYELVGKERKKEYLFWLEDICELIGYSSENNLQKNVLFKKFKENIDYVILDKFSTEIVLVKKNLKPIIATSSNLGGRPKKYIFINYNCLKMLLLQVNSTSEIYGKFLTEIQDISFEFVKKEKDQLEEENDKKEQKLIEQDKTIEKLETKNEALEKFVDRTEYDLFDKFRFDCLERINPLDKYSNNDLKLLDEVYSRFEKHCKSIKIKPWISKIEFRNNLEHHYGKPISFKECGRIYKGYLLNFKIIDCL